MRPFSVLCLMSWAFSCFNFCLLYMITVTVSKTMWEEPKFLSLKHIRTDHLIPFQETYQQKILN